MHVYFLWFYFDPQSHDNYNAFWNALKIIGFVLAYINSCINPIALYCVSTSFRKHFNRLLCCCGRHQDNGAGQVSVGFGSTYAGNGTCARDDGRDEGLTDEPASTTAISHYNSRRHVVVTATNSRGFKSPGQQPVSIRRHPAPAHQDEGYPLNEFTAQQSPTTTGLTKSIC